MDYFCNAYIDSDGETETKTYFEYRTSGGRFYERMTVDRYILLPNGNKAVNSTTGRWKRISEKAMISAIETYYNA